MPPVLFFLLHCNDGVIRGGLGGAQMFLLQSLSAFFALLAAGLWFYASRLRLPEKLTHITLDDEGGFGGELRELFSGVALQSKWNAWAAGSAGLAAAFQTLAIILEALK